jgi:hypothetical protein
MFDFFRKNILFRVGFTSGMSTSSLVLGNSQIVTFEADVSGRLALCFRMQTERNRGMKW